MNHFNDAYLIALLPRSSRRTTGTRNAESVVVITHDALDRSLSVLVYKSINAIDGLVRRVVSALSTWHKRRAAIRELMALNGRLLEDIGAHRGQIPSVVEALLNATPLRPVTVTRTGEKAVATQNAFPVAAPMKKSLAASLILLIAALPSLPALADHADNASGISDRFSLNFGGFVTDNGTDFRLDPDTPGRGTNLSLEDDLALDDSQTVTRLDGYYRFTHRSRVDFSYFNLSRDGAVPAGSTIQFGNMLVPVASTVVTESNLDIFNVTYTYSFFRNPRLELGVTAGLYVLELDLALSVPAFGEREQDEGTAPLPVVGLRSAYALTPKLFLKASFQSFELEVNGRDGELTDFRVALEHNTFRQVGFGIGYDRLDLDIEDNDDGDRLALDFEGVQLYTRVYF